MTKRNNYALALLTTLITHQMYAMYPPNLDQQLGPSSTSTYSTTSVPTTTPVYGPPVYDEVWPQQLASHAAQSTSALSSSGSSSSSSSASSKTCYPSVADHQLRYIQPEPVRTQPSNSTITRPCQPEVSDLCKFDYCQTSKKLMWRSTLISAALGFLGGASIGAKTTKSKEVSLVIGTGSALFCGAKALLFSWLYTPEVKYHNALEKIRSTDQDSLVQLALSDGQNTNYLAGAISQAYTNINWPLLAANWHFIQKSNVLTRIEEEFKNAINTAECWPYEKNELVDLVDQSNRGILIATRYKHHIAQAINAIKALPEYNKQIAINQTHQKQLQDQHYQQRRLAQEDEKLRLAHQQQHSHHHRH